jgi:hypothetical protein
MNICPKFVHLRATKEKEPGIFTLIEGSIPIEVKEVRANTPFLVSVRILFCHKMKIKKPSYCDMQEIREEHSDKQICGLKKNDYVFFFIDKSDKSQNKSPVYLIIFIRDSQVKSEACAIIKELKLMLGWLNIADDSVIHCYIFYYSTTPQVTTRNNATIKSYFTEPDNKFIYSIRSVPMKSPRILYVNGGSPKFDIKVQEA